MKKSTIIQVILVSIILLFATALQVAHAQSGVGIDVANPLEMLDVDGAIKIGADFNNTTGAPTGGAGTIRWNGTNFEGWDGTQWMVFGSATDTDWIESGTDIYNGNTGNIGIGTTAPASKLHLDDGLTTVLTIEGNRGLTGTPYGQIEFTNTDGGNANTLYAGASIRSHNGGGTDDGDLRFFTASNSILSEAVRIDLNGNVGVGDFTPDEKLDVEGAIKIGADFNNTTGAPTGGAGTIRWNGTNFEGWDGTQWIQFGSSGTSNVLEDADQDTKVQVEESADEDIIRFDIAGTERFIMDGGRLEVVNSNENVMIGDHAGESQTSGVNNIGLGAYALSNFTVGNDNISIGHSSFENATSIDYNVGLGWRAGYNVNTGDKNVLIGYLAGAGSASHSKYRNTMLGHQAGHFNEGDDNVFIGFTAGMNETGSDLLYIDNTNTASPLIYGEFNNNLVGLNGDVAIGHQSPQANLDVTGNANGTADNSLLLRSGNNYTEDISNQILFSWAGSANYKHALKTRHKSNQDPGNAFDFYVWDQGTDANGDVGSKLVMTIDGRDQGMVGIGTNSPEEELHVVGSMRMVDGNQVAGYIPVSDANGTMIWSNPTTITTAADGDGDSSNEIQTLSQSGTDVTLSNGGGTISVADDDNSTTNEIQNLTLSGNTLALSGSTPASVDLSAFNNPGTDNQNLESATLSAASLLSIGIEDGTGTSVSLAALEESADISQVASDLTDHETADGDLSATNEIQTLSQSGTDVTLSDGGGTISVADNDNSTTNEIQTLSISGNDISLSSGGGTVSVPTQTTLADADNDTKIQVEESTDEDIIRFDVAGTEYFQMQAGRVQVNNTNSNVFYGDDAGELTGTGQRNTVFGTRGMSSLTTGEYNTSIGDRPLVNLTEGNYNVGMGSRSMNNKLTGDHNIALGRDVMYQNSTGSKNIAVGSFALYNNNGSQNVAVGYDAGNSNTGSNSVFLGNAAGRNSTGSDLLYVDNTSTNSPLIYGEFDSNLLRVNGTLNVNNAYSFPTADGIGGYVMTTDGSGAVSWTDPTTITTAADGDGDSSNEIQTLSVSGADVTLSNGGGTVTVNDGDWTVAGNNQYSAVSGNVGVGTTSPTAKLEVAQPSTGAAMRLGRAAGSPNLEGNGQSSSSDWMIVDGNVANSGNVGLNYYSDGDAILANGGGNVGIGTTGPNGLLEVRKDEAGSITQIIVTNRGTTSSGTGTALAFRGYRDTDQNYEVGKIEMQHKSGTVGDLTQAADMIFYTRGASYNTSTPDERMRISSNGNVGIATSSPSYTLSFGGDADRTIQVEETTVDDGHDLTVQAGSAKAGTANNDGGMLILSSGAATGNGGTNPRSEIVFKTATQLGSSSSATQSPTEKMRIDANGNVGIGTSAPSATLDVVGSAQLNVGSPATGDVLTSTDALGNVAWTSPTANVGVSKTTGALSHSSDDNYEDVTGQASLDVNTGDIITVQAFASLRLTGGDNSDDFYYRVRTTGCATTDLNEVLYRPDEDSNDHDNFKSVPYLDYWVSTCTGTANFIFEVKNTGDDSWEAQDRVLIVRKN